MIDALFVVSILQIVTATSFGVLATTLIILGVWELMREGLPGIPGTLSMKIKSGEPNESE
jgi:hypothetical protein